MTQNVEPSSGESLDPARIASSSGGYLTLPFDQDQFKDFVIGLLGKPQEFNKKFIGQFQLTLQDIQSFYYLIDQRLSQQNKGVLILFRAKIHYDDKSAVTLNGIEELVNYREVNPVISTSIELSWHYLVNFEYKSHPEKQEIDVEILTSDHVLSTPEIWLDTGFFDVSIKYTARTWGKDIESLLKDHINSLMISESGFRPFLRKYRSHVSICLAVLFFLGTIVGVLGVTEIYVGAEVARITELLSSEPSISNKIDVIAQFIVDGGATRYYFMSSAFLLISLITSLVLAAYFADILDRRKPSFLLLTRKSFERRSQELKEMENQWKKFLLSIVFALVTNLISNYIFAWLVTQ